MNNKDQKRIFIGIPAGDQIKSILHLLKSAVNCNPRHIKWIPFENIHLTLSFLGDVSINKIPDIIQSVEHNIATAQFQLSISGTGVFPSSRSPKVLWLGIDKGIDELKLLHHQIKKSVTELKENYENNTFVPHISIARIRRLHRKIDVLAFLNSVYSPIDLEVDSISMYESKLFPKGAQYTIINTFPLN